MEVRQVFGSVARAWSKRRRISFCTQCGARTEESLHWGETRDVCTACGYRDVVRSTPVVAAVVVRGDEVLLCKRRPRLTYGGYWCLPSGNIDFGEDFLTAARRETLEETGIQIEIKSILTVISNFWDEGVSTVVPVVLAEPIGGEPQSTTESAEAAWFNAGALPDMAFESDKHIIERYFETRFEGLPVDLNYNRHDAPGVIGSRRPPQASKFTP